jgi:hypothetical protein
LPPRIHSEINNVNSGTDTAVMCLMNASDNTRFYTALNKAL